LLQAERNAKQARDERDAKDVALKAEQQARADETKARQQAFAALRSMTTNFVERKFAQGTVLTEDDRAFLRGVITQYDAFAQIKGDDPESRAAKAEGRFRVGTMRHKLGELQEAEKDYDEAVSIQKQLVAEFPTRPDFRQDLASSYYNQGVLVKETRGLQEAKKDFDQALSIRKQLAADFRSRPEFRQQLASSYNSQGNLLRNTGQDEEAEHAFDQAVSIQKQLADEFPSRAEFRQGLAQSHNNRGNLLLETRRRQEAEQDYDQALSIRKQLAADFPLRPELRQRLAMSHLSRGQVLSASGRRKDAKQDYDQAVSIQRQLVADFPTRLAFRQDLVASHLSRGKLLSGMGQRQEAEQDYDQALSILKQAVADFPDDQPDRHNELANTCVNLASIHKRKGDWAAAKRWLLEGQPHHLAALKAKPRHPTYRQFYRNHLNVLISVHAALLEQAQAVRTAETYRDLGWNPPADACEAACFLSRCIPIVAKHDKLDDKQRKEAAQFYGDAAMKLLREGVSRGWKDVMPMKKETGLDPLRQREDFKKLIAELEGKGK
jgi:tetratricopeptide (TPR) repeat protein